MLDTAAEVKTDSNAIFSNGPLHMDEQVLNDQQEFIQNTSVWTQDVV